MQWRGMRCSGSRPHQVHGDGSAQQEAEVDVDGVVLVLDDPGQAADDATHDEGEDQQWLEQLGRVGQRAVKVHLRTDGIELLTYEDRRH